MGRVFLSYATEDRSKVERLVTLLTADGHDVWWDREIEGGTEFAARIEEELAKADVVVVAWSKASVASRWVRDEASVAGDDNRLIPVSIDGTPSPLGFRQFQTIDMAGWTGRANDTRAKSFLKAMRYRLDLPPVEEAAPVGIARPGLGRRPALIALAAAMLVALIGGAYWRHTGAKGDGVGGGSKLTVAVVRFSAPQNDEALQVQASQAHDFIGGALGNSGVNVVDAEDTQAATRAKVDLALTGSFTRTNDKEHAVIKLLDLDTGLVVLNRKFESIPDEASFSDRVGAQIAGSIGWAAALISLEKRHPSNPPVMADLLSQLDFTNDRLSDLQSVSRAARSSPNSAFARISQAFLIAMNLDGLPEGDRERAVMTGREAAKRALELAPEFGDSYALDCFLKSEIYRQGCEKRLLEGYRIDPNAPFITTFLSQFYEDVGRWQESLEYARLSNARDPYVPTKMGWLIRALEVAGESAEAAQTSAKARAWWPELTRTFVANHFLGLTVRGDFAGLGVLAKSEDLDGVAGDMSRMAPVSLAVQTKSLPRLKQTCAPSKTDPPGYLCMVAFAQLGDLDSAFAIADMGFPRRVGRNAEESNRIWLSAPSGNPAMPQFIQILSAPSAAPLRRDPRFMTIARRTGLLDYWRTVRLPDFCTKANEPVCGKLRSRS